MITEKEIEKLAEEKYPIEIRDEGRTIAGGHYDIDINYRERLAFIAGCKAALQNKVSDGKIYNPLKEMREEIIAANFTDEDFKVSDISAEVQSEYELLLIVKNELLNADKLPFAERVEANKGILNLVSIKRKPIVNERKDNVADLLEKDNDIIAVGKCANCGVEYHIHPVKK